jgi:nitroreductase
MFNDASSPAALLATRRSAKPRDLLAPGPDGAQLRRILSAAIRTPDHGKLTPWRFVIVPGETRDALANLLQEAFRELHPGADDVEQPAIEQFARQAPTLVVAISRPLKTSHIPIWEQELSAGAACMNLLMAAHAEGFLGAWVTGWAAYSETVRAAFAPEGRIAGFIFLGSPGHAVEERLRPAYDEVVTQWPGGD